MTLDDETRDRVRALVRDVLANALPEERENATTSASGDTPQSAQTRFINTAPEESSASAKEFTRDESSKMVITETDVRGLEEGARLRIAEGARLTPLAADIVHERRIELIRRVPRRGSRASKVVAVGADHGGFKMKEELT